jgi:hypothetical protein
MKTTATETITNFLASNSFGFFPASEILRKTGLTEAEFKPAWAALRKAGKVVTHKDDKKYWGLAK